MKTLHDLQNEMQACGLGDYFDALEPMARNAIRIHPEIQAEEEIPVGASKLGGCPDLPAGMSWFYTPHTDVPMSFIAQVNFAEAAPWDIEHQLPEQGILYFFYDCSADGMNWGFDPDDKKGWKVFFYDGDLSALVRTPAPAELDDEDVGMVFGSARITFSAEVELPPPESDLTNEMSEEAEEDGLEAYWDWLEERREEEIYKLLGHADPVQNGMELECEYVTHRLNCGTPEGFQQGKARGLDQNAAHWQLLLQVDSCEELDMMWGDLGRLYFWITKEDLAARRFENTWLILQCY